MKKTYPSGSEAVQGNETEFKELTTAAEKFFDTPKTPKRFPKKGFELPTLMASIDCRNN